MTMLKLFSLALLASVTVTACTPQAQTTTNTNTSADVMMEKENGDSMEKQDDGAMMEKKDGDTMVEVNAGVDVMVGETVVVELDAFNFGYSQSEIRVKQGDTVRVVMTSTDGFHDWVVDEFGAATEQVRTGGTTEVTFAADTKGSFEYYCSVGSHRAQGMVGTLIVE